ncbi:MAG: NADH-quinone oxidoreductase subunit L [Thermoguttaceae bacterium]
MESYIPNLLIAIPALPLLAAAVVAVLGKRVLREQSHWPVVLALVGSCLASVLLIFAVQQAANNHEHERVVRLWTWANVGAGSGEQGAQHSVLSTQHSELSTPAFRMDIVLRADSLTAIMLGMVTFISTLVVIYASGYMHGDPGYWRFFAYVALFVFSMTMLVSVSNFVLLYVFWEAVGLCSYLLIGFWFEKPVAAAAGMKAFLVNRVGDCGFALGVFLLWTTFGTLNFHDSKVQTIPATDGHAATTVVSIDPRAMEDANIPGTVERGLFGHSRLTQDHPFGEGGAITAICLLLFVGACGKSAQFPLHVWLPDAMEGPTPVSALIHAATMVTAGVYMVARCTPLYAAAPYAQEGVSTIGGFTALFAALIALTQTDLKRILAYSTVSQLGYMFLALGTGSQPGVTSGMFHLFTHAFFKALLFLGAGSVMHAMGGVIDIRQFGGLRRKMPITHWTFLFGCLALSGIVPFAGFWSKDAILAAVAEKASQSHLGSIYGYLYYAGTFTAFLTAFYTFRAYFLTFHGEERIPKAAGHHAHESSAAMTGPLVILAIGALTVGAYFQWTGDFLRRDGFLMQTPPLTALQLTGLQTEAAATSAHGPSEFMVSLISTAVALAGIGLAWLFYIARPDLAAATVKSSKSLGLYALSHGKFFIDEIYAALIVRPLEALAALLALVDNYLIDGMVNAVGAVPRALGSVFRPLQGGLVQFYALVMALGVLALFGALLW